MSIITFGLSNNNKHMRWWIRFIGCLYRQACGSSRLAWSKGRRSRGRHAVFITWTVWTLAELCRDDSIINIVLSRCRKKHLVSRQRGNGIECVGGCWEMPGESRRGGKWNEIWQTKGLFWACQMKHKTKSMPASSESTQKWCFCEHAP